MNRISLNQIDQLIAQRRVYTGKKWSNHVLIYDLFWELMEGKELEDCFHLHPDFFKSDESLETRFGVYFPQIAWVEQTHDYWYLLTRRGWEKIWRNRLKFYRRGRVRRYPQWKRDRDAAQKAAWEARMQQAKDSGNYLSI